VNRNDLQEISGIRVREAKALLEDGHFAGAYYLAGYSIECAIKACIAKQIKRYEFPDRNLANDAWSHNLGNLMKIAGLGIELQASVKTNKNLELNWAVVKDWNESSRYETGITESQASDLCAACFMRGVGILSWVKKRW